MIIVEKFANYDNYRIYLSYDSCRIQLFITHRQSRPRFFKL